MTRNSIFAKASFALSALFALAAPAPAPARVRAILARSLAVSEALPPEDTAALLAVEPVVAWGSHPRRPTATPRLLGVGQRPTGQVPLAHSNAKRCWSQEAYEASCAAASEEGATARP